ncbi:hypothetical protein [uncultured Campylobacter sp.]|nr:hypothetical protein [uncultured Campylobacter sp.]
MEVWHFEFCNALKYKEFGAKFKTAIGGHMLASASCGFCGEI